LRSEICKAFILKPSGNNTKRFVKLVNTTVINKLSAVMKRLVVLQFKPLK